VVRYSHGIFPQGFIDGLLKRGKIDDIESQSQKKKGDEDLATVATTSYDWDEDESSLSLDFGTDKESIEVGGASDNNRDLLPDDESQTHQGDAELTVAQGVNEKMPIIRKMLKDAALAAVLLYLRFYSWLQYGDGKPSGPQCDGDTRILECMLLEKRVEEWNKRRGDQAKMVNQAERMAEIEAVMEPYNVRERLMMLGQLIGDFKYNYIL
jgi:hypothetical protein